MKKPLAIRIDEALLDASRECAAEENRTLTNLIETVLRRHIAATKRQVSSISSTVVGPDARN